MVTKIVTLFCIKNPENEKSKKVKTRRVFDDDFKAQIVKMRIAAQINSGKNVPELSNSFDIGVHQKGVGIITQLLLAIFKGDLNYTISHCIIHQLGFFVNFGEKYLLMQF